MVRFVSVYGFSRCYRINCVSVLPVKENFKSVKPTRESEVAQMESVELEWKRLCVQSQHRDGVWSWEFDPAFCQNDWSQALAPPSHSLHPSLLPSLTWGQRLKCLRDGVVMLVWRGLTPSEDLTGALLFSFFFLIPFLSGHRGESEPQSNTHERVYCERWALLQ